VRKQQFYTQLYTNSVFLIEKIFPIFILTFFKNVDDCVVLRFRLRLKKVILVREEIRFEMRERGKKIFFLNFDGESGKRK